MLRTGIGGHRNTPFTKRGLKAVHSEKGAHEGGLSSRRPPFTRKTELQMKNALSSTSSARLTRLLGSLALGIGAAVALAPTAAAAAEQRCYYGNDSADSGTWLEYFGTSYFCYEGNWVEQKNSCYYSGAWTAHGSTRFSYRCDDGTWREVDYKQCRYDGRDYGHGQSHSFNGYRQECHDGDWKKTQPIYCDFDGKRYGHQEYRYGYDQKYQCDTGNWNRVDYDHCEFRGAHYRHGGKTAFDGYNQECYDGKWKQGAALVCFAGGNAYPHGHILRGQNYKYVCDTGNWDRIEYARCEFGGRYYEHGKYEYYGDYRWQCEDGQWSRDVHACEWEGSWAEEGQRLDGETLSCLCTSSGWQECRSIPRAW